MSSDPTRSGRRSSIGVMTPISHRLLVAGPAGCGKTTELLQVAHLAHPNYAVFLCPCDRDRLYAFALASDSNCPQQSLAERSLSLSPGARLRDGQLSLQVFVDENRCLPIGMNIQLKGTDPARGDRSTYLRYDLDAVAMGEAMGAVTHFNAHWHVGDDPDAEDAEDHDPRLPSLILDPIAVIEYMVETFYPNEPDDLG